MQRANHASNRPTRRAAGTIFETWFSRAAHRVDGERTPRVGARRAKKLLTVKPRRFSFRAP
jgi:hypothetical protein